MICAHCRLRGPICGAHKPAARLSRAARCLGHGPPPSEPDEFSWFSGGIYRTTRSTACVPLVQSQRLLQQNAFTGGVTSRHRRRRGPYWRWIGTSRMARSPGTHCLRPLLKHQQNVYGRCGRHGTTAEAVHISSGSKPAFGTVDLRASRRIFIRESQNPPYPGRFRGVRHGCRARPTEDFRCPRPVRCRRSTQAQRARSPLLQAVNGVMPMRERTNSSCPNHGKKRVILKRARRGQRRQVGLLTMEGYQVSPKIEITMNNVSCYGSWG